MTPDPLAFTDEVEERDETAEELARRVARERQRQRRARRGYCDNCGSIYCGGCDD